jgi:hypothetical protein
LGGFGVSGIAGSSGGFGAGGPATGSAGGAGSAEGGRFDAQPDRATTHANTTIDFAVARLTDGQLCKSGSCAPVLFSNASTGFDEQSLARRFFRGSLRLATALLHDSA